MTSFVDEYYVGFQKNRYATTEDQRLLGFITPKTNDKAYEKRKYTVDRWRDKNIEPRVIKNEPVLGFKVVDTVSRYSTSNKLFRVYDPRGFELEITADNLFYIIRECGIVKGMITEPMLWAREGSKPFLINASSKAYVDYLKGPDPKEKLELVPGKFFKHPGADIFYRFEGKFYYNLLDLEMNRNDPDEYEYRWYGYRRSERTDFSRVKTAFTYKVNRKNDKPIMAFTQFSFKDGAVKSKSIHLRKSPFKGLIPVEASEVPGSVGEDGIKVGVPFSNDLNRGGLRVDTIIGAWGTKFVLFTDRPTARSKTYTIDELDTYFSSWYKDKDRYYLSKYGSITKELEYIDD